ncbi:MAG: sensor histidine kinase [Lysobacter sp.]|nr:MAG: sensor histidine kinase [Lysobacter sp.]
MEASHDSTGNAVSRPPSLRRRLLTFLLIPTMVLMLLDTAFVYLVALHYSNRIHDHDLAVSTSGLAKALQDGRSGGRLNHEARLLLEYNPNGRSFYSVRSLRHGFISGSVMLTPVSRAVRFGAPPMLSNAIVDGLAVRVASVLIPSMGEGGDALVVSMAETLRDREERAQEILLITIPIQALLFIVLLALVWKGVQVGLRILDPPIRRLALRERNLEPISGPDIPVEILPLTRTIDGLFARVQKLVSLQDRFVADAAHQLRTPLTGLAMHVERAVDAKSDVDLRHAMAHIQALTGRVTRSATQLLSLARVQGLPDTMAPMARVDLAKWVPAAVASRVPDALQAGVDLGYEGDTEVVLVDAQSNALQELLDNLIDNALSHVKRDGVITVSLRTGTKPGAEACIAIDDDGPGVAADILPRLGERFFRAPGAPEGGSGLGLAIVQRIADAHGAFVAFTRSGLGGLRVDVVFPVVGSTDLP